MRILIVRESGKEAFQNTDGFNIIRSLEAADRHVLREMQRIRRLDRDGTGEYENWEGFRTRWYSAFNCPLVLLSCGHVNDPADQRTIAATFKEMGVACVVLNDRTHSSMSRLVKPDEVPCVMQERELAEFLMAGGRIEDIYQRACQAAGLPVDPALVPAAT